MTPNICKSNLSGDNDTEQRERLTHEKTSILKYRSDLYFYRQNAGPVRMPLAVERLQSH